MSTAETDRDASVLRIHPDFAESKATPPSPTEDNTETLLERLSDVYGAEDWLMPLTICDEDGGDIYGIVDGISYVKGIRQTADSLINIGGVDHLVIQDAFRTGRRNYLAVELA